MPRNHVKILSKLISESGFSGTECRSLGWEGRDSKNTLSLGTAVQRCVHPRNHIDAAPSPASHNILMQNTSKIASVFGAFVPTSCTINLVPEGRWETLSPSILSCTWYYFAWHHVVCDIVYSHDIISSTFGCKPYAWFLSQNLTQNAMRHLIDSKKT